MKNLKIQALLTGILFTLASSAFAKVPQPYGAIAYSPTDGKYGVAQKNVNQEAAEQQAMGNCAVIAGGKSCRVVVWYFNACGALSVASNGSWGANWGSTTSGELMKGINAAYQKARKSCVQFGGTDCELKQATCSFDTP